MNIREVAARLFHAEGQDMKNFLVAFNNFAKASEEETIRFAEDK
jgi:hypothetical protein